MHAIVKAAEYDAPMNVVVATIPGDGSTNEEFHFTAHLFEGIAKQGANDNCGGPATQLEAGRAWIEMIKDGTLPKPKRTVRFLWVPEIQRHAAYLREHPELGQHVVALISTDMVGANQTINHNSLHLNQTMYSIPSVINDVSRQFFEYVGETNREKLHNRRIGYAFQNPIIDPSGTRDPFWYNIEKFYGASDHQVHLDWNPRIPAVQFGNWPDAVYHSSDDSPANQDPTQMKRAAFLMIAVANVFATRRSGRRRGGRRPGRVLRPEADGGGSRGRAVADCLEHRGHAQRSVQGGAQPGASGLSSRMERSAVGGDAGGRRQGGDRRHQGLRRAAA